MSLKCQENLNRGKNEAEKNVIVKVFLGIMCCSIGHYAFADTWYRSLLGGGNVKVYYHSSVNTYGYEGVYDSARSNWNGISSKVSVTEMSSNASTYDQYFVGTTAAADLLGEHQKYKKDTSGTIVVAQNNDEWHHSTIIIYDNVMDSYSMSTQQRIGNATHDSLKLAHPGWGTERVRAVPSGKVAIMQQGIASYGPQEYDEVELKAKWGT